VYAIIRAILDPSKLPVYYRGCNQALLRAVPAAARRILEVGCAEGRLGAALKQQDPHRAVYGLEREPAVAARAAERLDRVFALDVEREAVPLEPGSLDCLVYGGVLEHLHDPESVLRRHRPLLAAGPDHTVGLGEGGRLCPP